MNKGYGARMAKFALHADYTEWGLPAMPETAPPVARDILESSIVIDGCTFALHGTEFPGYEALIGKGLVTAMFLTVPFAEQGPAAAQRSINKLWREADAPGSGLAIAICPDDVRRAKAQGKTAMIITFQHWEPIGNSLDALHGFWRLGLRVQQIAYNEMGHAAAGCLEDGDFGLTRLGRRAVPAMNELGLMIDLSHASDLTCREVIDATTKPVVLSHANPRSRAPNPRNKPDDIILGVAATGGVIGLSPWGPICWRGPGHPRPTLADFAGHVAYVADLVGVDHIAFGSDTTVDGAVDTVDYWDTALAYPEVAGDYSREVGDSPAVRYPEGFGNQAGLPLVVDALQEQGFGRDDIGKFLGHNLMRVWAEILPGA